VTGLKQRLSKRADRLKDRVEGNAFLRFIWDVAREWKRDDATDRAGAVAYHAFLSILPLLLGIVALLGFFLPDADVRKAVSDALLRVLPGSAEFVENNLDAVIELREISGVIGLLGLLWSGSNMFAAIRRALNRAWGISQERGFVAGKARDLVMVLGAGLLFLLSLAAVNLVAIIGETDRLIINAALAFGSRFIGFLLALLVFLIVYKFVPNTKTIWRWTWQGALLAAVAFQVGTYAFIFYLTHFANFQSIYGPLGSVIALMLWIYLSSIMLILGAEVAAELHRMKVGDGKTTKAASVGK
jgi:membrane protein